MKKIKKGWWGFILFAALIAAVVVAMAPSPHGHSIVDVECLVKVPVIMYHDVVEFTLREDDYLISACTLERDIQKMLEAGFKPIAVSSLIDYVYNGTPLPDKSVVLVFDDGYAGVKTQVLPLLEKYDIQAAVSIIGARAQRVEDGGCNADYMSWADIREAESSGHVEFISHSAGLHVYRARKGASRMMDESIAHYREVLTADIAAMNAYAKAENVDLLPVFAYPYGYVEPEAERILHDAGFIATFTSEEHVNLISGDKQCLYQLGRLNRSGYMKTAQLIRWMENAG